MIGFWWLLSLVVLAIETVLLILIFAFYSGIHRRTGGRLFIGMELFSSLFIAQDAVGVWAILNFASHFGSSVSIPLASMNLIGLAAVVSLYFMLKT